MKYYINKTINTNLETATEIVTEELQKEGFGIVTRFDVNKALKEKLDVDFRQYRVLGACNPALMVADIDNDEMKMIAGEINEKLQRVITSI